MDGSIDREEALTQLKSEIEELRTKKGYLLAGIPRFRGLFGRDSIISAWQLLPYDTKIARDTLIELSRLQGRKKNPATGEQPGKILHEFYDTDTKRKWFKEQKEGIPWLKIGKPVYFSVDSTPLYLILFSRYFESQNDPGLFGKLMPHALAA